MSDLSLSDFERAMRAISVATGEEGFSFTPGRSTSFSPDGAVDVQNTGNTSSTASVGTGPGFCKCCGHCGELSDALGNRKPSNLKLCDGCHTMSYCSRECQRADWAKHKGMCKLQQRLDADGANVSAEVSVKAANTASGNCKSSAGNAPNATQSNNKKLEKWYYSNPAFVVKVRCLAWLNRDAEALVVGQCRFTPGFRRWPHACFQLLKLKCDKLLSNFAFNCNLRHYVVVVETMLSGADAHAPTARAVPRRSWFGAAS